jgi:hypothetical protein
LQALPSPTTSKTEKSRLILPKRKEILEINPGSVQKALSSLFQATQSSALWKTAFSSFIYILNSHKYTKSFRVKVEARQNSNYYKITKGNNEFLVTRSDRSLSNVVDAITLRNEIFIGSETSVRLKKSVTWSNEEPTLIGYSSYVDRIFADAAVQTDELRSEVHYLAGNEDRKILFFKTVESARSLPSMATNISYNMPSTCLPMPLTSTLNVLITGHWKSGKSMLIKSLLHNAKNVKCLSLLNQAVVNTFDIIDESLDHQSLTFSLIECPVRDASGQNLCVNYINLQMNRALQHEFLHLYSFERPTDLVDPCVHVCLYLMKFENEEGATENDIKFFTELGETKVPIVPLIACSDLYSEEKLSAIRKKLNEDFDGIIYDFPYKKDRTNLPLALSLVNHRIVVEDHYYSPDNKNRWKAIVYGLLWFNTIIIIRNYEKFAANFKYKIKKKHGM